VIGISAGLGILSGVAFGAWGAFAFVAGVVAVCSLRRVVPSTAAVVVVSLLTAIGVWRHVATSIYSPESLGKPPDLAALIVVSNPDLGGSFQQFVASPIGNPGTRICITARSLPVARPGDHLAVGGAFGLPQDEPLRIRRFLESRGCVVSVFAQWFQITGSEPAGRFSFGRIRTAVSESLRNLVPGDAGALLAGLAVGDDSALSTERAYAFTNTGTTHLTAVSGSNLALIAGMLVAFGRATVGQHRLAWQVVTISGIWTFAFVSGAEPPAVRAAIVATVALLAIRFGRAADFPSLILLAGGIMALVDPSQVGRIGFQLSIAASLALALVIPVLSARSTAGAVSTVISATAVAQIATLPILLAVFGTLSVLSIPANALVAPLAGVAMPLAGLAGILGLANSRLGEIAAPPSAVAADLIIGIVDRLGSTGASIVVGIPPTPSSFVLAATCASLVWILASRRQA
jgi:ComEC/Rec2-related protein